MYGMLSTLVTIAQLAAAIAMFVIVGVMIVEHPIEGLIAITLVYLLMVRPVWRWVRRQWVAESRRQRLSKDSH
jgi:NhaP-type Na+/H+ or K+/H+ antiporter